MIDPAKVESAAKAWLPLSDNFDQRLVDHIMTFDEDPAQALIKCILTATGMLERPNAAKGIPPEHRSGPWDGKSPCYGFSNDVKSPWV